jgi:hypothetical protein
VGLGGAKKIQIGKYGNDLIALAVEKTTPGGLMNKSGI